MARQKCQHPNGVIIRPNGVDAIDPCRYVQKEIHTNATVIVSQCKYCGHVLIEWMRTDETEDIIYGALEEVPEE